MIVPSSLLLLLSASLAEAATSLGRRIGRAETGQECGTPYSKHENEVMMKAFEKIKHRRQATTTTYEYEVHFNVLSANMTYAGGWVPDKQITDQVALLNTGYDGTGISFKLANTTRIISRKWFETLNVPEDALAEQELFRFGTLFRKGGATTLNVNLISFSADEETFGFGLPPSFYPEYPKFDGVYIRYNSLPGGSSLARQGSTTIHEVGHWLALWHTFQDGCDGEGDSVDDTPAEATPASGCPVGRDSCPGSPGVDPINNFMDYTAEGCRNSFTPGQVSRMHSAAGLRETLD